MVAPGFLFPFGKTPPGLRCQLFGEVFEKVAAGSRICHGLHIAFAAQYVVEVPGHSPEGWAAFLFCRVLDISRKHGQPVCPSGYGRNGLGGGLYQVVVG